MKLTNHLSSLLVGTLILALGAANLRAEEASPGVPEGQSELAAATNAATSTAPAMAEDPEPGSNDATNASPEATPPRAKSERVRDPVVVIGGNAHLKAGETAEALVAVGGSGKVDGKVTAAAVAVFGDLEINGEVGDAAVAVLGNVKLGPNAKIHGDAVSVGGSIDKAEGAVIEGEEVPVNFQIPGLPNLTWIRDWFVHCVLKLRPLSLQVGWVWGVAGVFFLLYVLVAALFPRPVQACVDELSRRPATTMFMGLLTMMLAPVVLIILAATGIGLLVFPFAIAAFFLAGLLGKVALLEWLGLRLGGSLGGDTFRKPLPALFLGSVVLVVLYLIPVIGLMTLLLTILWGLGCAMTTAFGSFKRETPGGTTSAQPPYTPPPSPAPVPSVMAVAPMASVAFAEGPGLGGLNPVADASAGFAGASGSGAMNVGASAPAAAPIQPPVLPEALSFPRGTFWERMGAGFLDIVLVSILGHFVGGAPLGYLVALAYFTGMWAWRGTTIGGIVLGLKVVRVDGHPVSFAVALVRALSAAFSIVILFLGFLWIAWDPDKQGWHDRIAGTVVVRLPKGTPLLCV